MKQQVMKGELNPCIAYKKIQQINMIKAEKETQAGNVNYISEAQKRKAKSVERAAIVNSFSQMSPQENQHFEELLAHTLK